MKKALGVVLAVGLAAAVCTPALAIHARPGGGSPLRASFVPAYKPCTTPNATHVAPLVFPSCSPTSLVTPILTTDRGAMSGFARFTVFCGDGEMPPCDVSDGVDSEDVAVRVSITDVRCATGGVAGCTAPGADYTGTLIERTVMRITDHANDSTTCANGAGDPPCTTATLSDLAFTFPIPCADNGGPNGAKCEVLTSLDSMVPEFVRERQRGIVSEAGHTVLDAGFDGDIGAACPPVCGTGDEFLFLEQGVFAP